MSTDNARFFEFFMEDSKLFFPEKSISTTSAYVEIPCEVGVVAKIQCFDFIDPVAATIVDSSTLKSQLIEWGSIVFYPNDLICCYDIRDLEKWLLPTWNEICLYSNRKDIRLTKMLNDKQVSYTLWGASVDSVVLDEEQIIKEVSVCYDRVIF